jgi:deazaflavin-dependent oxidoreductase (nitroreductase family)
MQTSSAPSLSQFEADFFSGLNSIVEPYLRAGFGTPGPCANGVILLETIGRKSGRTINVPLMAFSFGDMVIVSTVRARRSQWIRNVATNSEVRYWLHRRARKATAFVIGDGGRTAVRDRMPPHARAIAAMLHPLTISDNVAFALLMPQT